MTEEEIKKTLLQMHETQQKLILHFASQMRNAFDKDEFDDALSAASVLDSLKNGNFDSALRYMEPIGEDVIRNVDEALRKAGFRE